MEGRKIVRKGGWKGKIMKRWKGGRIDGREDGRKDGLKKAKNAGRMDLREDGRMEEIKEGCKLKRWKEL